jgi:hypothetical protein
MAGEHLVPGEAQPETIHDVTARLMSNVMSVFIAQRVAVCMLQALAVHRSLIIGASMRAATAAAACKCDGVVFPPCCIKFCFVTNYTCLSFALQMYRRKELPGESATGKGAAKQVSKVNFKAHSSSGASLPDAVWCITA